MAFLIETRESTAMIPSRLGLTPESLHVWLKRINRADLWDELLERGRREWEDPKTVPASTGRKNWRLADRGRAGRAS